MFNKIFSYKIDDYTNNITTKSEYIFKKNLVIKCCLLVESERLLYN